MIKLYGIALSPFARKALLAAFELVGSGSDLANSYRRKLSSILF